MASLYNEVELKGGGSGGIAEEGGTFRPIYTLDGEVLSSSASFLPPLSRCPFMSDRHYHRRPFLPPCAHGDLGKRALHCPT